MVNGKPMSMFEVAVRAVMTNTIRRGNPRDLKALFVLLDKHGAISTIAKSANDAADRKYRSTLRL